MCGLSTTERAQQQQQHTTYLLLLRVSVPLSDVIELSYVSWGGQAGMLPFLSPSTPSSFQRIGTIRTHTRVGERVLCDVVIKVSRRADFLRYIRMRVCKALCVLHC